VQAVELLGRPFPERPPPVLEGGIVLPRIDHDGLRGTAVGIEVAGFRRAGRPAVGLKVVQVEVVVRDDPTNGIAPIIGAPHVVTLLPDQHVIPLRGDLAALLGGENVEQTASRSRLHLRLRPRNARRFQEGRGQVDETDVIVDDAARIRDAFAPHDRHRHVVREAVRLSLDPRKRHAVVGGYDHQGVGQLALLFQKGEHLPQVPVEILDFEGIVEHVGPHRVGVGPEGRDAINGLQSFPALAAPGPVLVAPMRFVSPIPEGEGLVGGFLVEKGFEVGRVVRPRHRRRRRLRRLLFVGLPGQMPRPALAARDARRPPLPGVADAVSVFGKRFGVGGECIGPVRPVVGCRAELPRVAPREKRRAGRGTLRIRRVGSGEEQPLFGDAVEGRRVDPVGAVRPKVGKRGIVRHGNEDVRALRTQWFRLAPLASGRDQKKTDDRQKKRMRSARREVQRNHGGKGVETMVAVVRAECRKESGKRRSE